MKIITARLFFTFLFLLPLFFLPQDVLANEPTTDAVSTDQQSTDEQEVDEYEDEEEIYDPLEGFNRKVFWFNDKFDSYLFEPVAEGYDYVTPGVVQTGVSNFFKNLKYPVYLISDILQLKFTQAYEHTARFAINSTLGLGGVIDTAKDLGFPHHYEDVGVALGYWGVPPGPYIVLPILGPSCLRDLFGKVADTAAHPTFYPVYFTNATDAQAYLLGTLPNVIDAIDTRADLLETIRDAKETSLDYYLFIQAAYYQVREGHITDGKSAEND